MIKFGDVYPDKCGSMENGQGQVKPNVSSKYKFPMSLIFHENEEVVKNDEEVEDDDDVCNFKAKDVGSSCNPADVNNRERVKTSVDGGVDEEPGGNVSARSRSLGFRQSRA